MVASPAPVPTPIAIVRACARAACTITIERPYVGGSLLRVRVARSHGASVAGTRVTASVDMARMVMHPEVYTLRAGPHETFSAPVTLDMPGHWHALVTVTIGKNATRIEIPFYVENPPDPHAP